jgi:transcription initiation factor TFIID subunit 2
MSIKQTQESQPSDVKLRKDSFLRDLKEDVRGVWAGPIQPLFIGPMTIRIHEADGTPYEHIVEIKEVNTRFDIPYNTKYKRLKRSRRQKERAAAAAGIDISADAQDDVLLYCLGDVLQSEEEVRDWKLVDWAKEDEERMNQESYEWIRMDADFEWICKLQINMPSYMFQSQLQQDRDVVAQYEVRTTITDFNLHSLTQIISHCNILPCRKRILWAPQFLFGR